MEKLKQFCDARFLIAIPWHRFFFVFFIFSLPFSIRKVLGVFPTDGNGTFNEYLDISLYLSDILLATTLLSFILENRLLFLSIGYWRRMFHVEHLLLPIFIPLFFIFWSGLSIFWSANFFLALFTFSKLAEGYFLYLYILVSNVPRGTLGQQEWQDNCSTWNICKKVKQLFHVEHSRVLDGGKNVPRGTFWQIIFSIIIISAFFQSIIAILQFIQQGSLGLTFLKESVFSVYDPGIAKILINGNIFTRSYGTFPHPNVLGGFLGISLLISTAYPLIFGYRMFHVEHPIARDSTKNVPRGTFWKLLNICSTWNICEKVKQLFHVEHFDNVWLYRILIFVQLLALFLSFSKSAILGFITGFIMFIYNTHRMFHVEHLGDGTKDGEIVPRGTIIDYYRNRSPDNYAIFP